MKNVSESGKNRSKDLRSGWILLFFIFLFLCSEVCAEEHAVEKGETALQIAIDHDLTMDQLSRLNPDKDLEMMRVGDILILPDPGRSFEEFLESRYSEKLRAEDLNCQITADRGALCLFHAVNLSDLPLYDVRFQASVRGNNGITETADAAIALMQILPGEKLPVFVKVPGDFGGITGASVSVQHLSYSEMLATSFRVAEDLYDRTDLIFPDGIGAVSSILFSGDGAASLAGRKINVLAAAYDGDGALAGIRSLYSDFYPRLDITVYSAGPVIESVKIFMEVY